MIKSVLSSESIDSLDHVQCKAPTLTVWVCIENNNRPTFWMKILLYVLNGNGSMRLGTHNVNEREVRKYLDFW